MTLGAPKRRRNGGWMANEIVPRAPIKVGGSDLAGEIFSLCTIRTCSGEGCKP
jgi:hypothetical protein